MRAAQAILWASFSVSMLGACWDWSEGRVQDAATPDAGTSSDGDAGACPARSKVCRDQCGELVLAGCPAYVCGGCGRDGQCVDNVCVGCAPVASCESVAAQCGTVDTGCGIASCDNLCTAEQTCDGVRCCDPEDDLTLCAGSCGATLANRCGQQVVCPAPCGIHSEGCAEGPGTHTCLCRHAWQGKGCAEYQIPLLEPLDLGLDLAAGLAYVLDGPLAAIIAVGLETGNRRVLSDADDAGVARGTGRAFERVTGMAVDAPRGQAFVTDAGLLAVLQVDLQNGNRLVLSDESDDGVARGTGLAFSIPRGVAVDLDKRLAYVIDAGLDALIQVDLTNGNRTVVSRTGDAATARGAGAPFQIPVALTLDVAGQRAFVVDTGAETVVQVDLASGDRTLVSGPDGSQPIRGKGPPFQDLNKVAFDSLDGRLLVSDFGLDAVIQVDLTTGNRVILSDADDEGSPRGTGPGFSFPANVAFDSARNRAFVVDSVLAAVVNIDLTTGDRVLAFDGGVGAGTALTDPVGLALDAVKQRVFVVDNKEDSLVRVDLVTGQRTVVSDADDHGTPRGSGTAFDLPMAVALDPSANLAYVVDLGLDAVLRVNLQTGNRTVLSDADDNGFERGTGTGFATVSGVVFGAQGLFVIDEGVDVVMRVDPDTGNRTVVSGGTATLGVRGTGPNFVEPVGIALDPASGVAFVVDKLRNALLRVDLESGDRTLVSDDADDGGLPKGVGPAFELPAGVALDAANGQAYVVDIFSKAVLRVELATGDRSLLSAIENGGPQRGAGPGFSRPEGIAIDVSGGRAYVVDKYNAAVFGVALDTGDRVLASRVTF